MPFDAIACRNADVAGGGLVLRVASWSSPQAFLEATQGLDEPTLFLLPSSAAGRLSTHAVSTAGRKSDTRELAWYYLRKKRATNDVRPLLVDGTSYTRAGRVRQGVAKLLKRAAESGKRGAWLLSVRDELFERLARSTSEGAGRSDQGPAASDEGIVSRLLGELAPMPPSSSEALKRILGTSSGIKLARELVLRVADLKIASDDGRERFLAPGLILGDSGTGKELVARAIHESGETRGHRFVIVNCPAIAENLFEAELFGVEAGTATGVSRRAGLWEIAGRGTLFLDELGDLPLHQQSKVLRALAERRIRRVGGSEDLAAPARVIAATNCDLPAMVERGAFRLDLYHRLRNWLIVMPPLREHPEDIPLLAQHIWRSLRAGSHLPGEVVEALQKEPWPGNVRELRGTLIGLYALFGLPTGTTPLAARHVRQVLDLGGLQRAQLSGGGHGDQGRWRARIRMLWRVREVLTACRALFGSRKVAGATGPTLPPVQVVRQRIGELEALESECAYDEDLLQAVRRVRALAESLEVTGNATDAQRAAVAHRLGQLAARTVRGIDKEITGLVREA